VHARDWLGITFSRRTLNMADAVQIYGKDT
jgi:hypothetical protein